MNNVHIVGYHMAAAVIQHNTIVITEPYSVADPEPSTSFRQLSDSTRGLSTATGWLSSTNIPF